MKWFGWNQQFKNELPPYILTRVYESLQNIFLRHVETPPGYPFQVRPTRYSNALRAFHYYPLPIWNQFEKLLYTL